MKKVVMVLVLAGLVMGPLCALPWEKPEVVTPIVTEETGKKSHKVSETSGSGKVAKDDGWHFGVGLGADTDADGNVGVDAFGTVRKDSVFGVFGVGYNPAKDISDPKKENLHGFAGVGYEF